jgi:hypothetical protein
VLSAIAQPFKFLNRQYDNDRPSVLLNNDWLRSREVDQASEAVFGVFRRHVLHGGSRLIRWTVLAILAYLSTAVRAVSP